MRWATSPDHGARNIHNGSKPEGFVVISIPLAQVPWVGPCYIGDFGRQPAGGPLAGTNPKAPSVALDGASPLAWLTFGDRMLWDFDRADVACLAFTSTSTVNPL